MPTQTTPTRGYLSHFCLVSDPFSLTPDPRFLFVSETHAEAMAALDLGLMERRGLIVVVGEVGTGKTTLAHHMLSTAGSGVHLAYISNTTLTFSEILQSVLSGFGVTPKGFSKWDLLVSLTEFVTAADRREETVAIIVDEAQNLSPGVLEEFRLLLNLETRQRKLLQIVLLGQPELHQMLQRPQLRHLTDRIAVRCFINPLSRDDSVSYIEHRLLCAAGVSETFSEKARRRIVKEARGIPRAINILCHNALLFAFGRGGNRVEAVDATAAIREKRGQGLVLTRPRWRPSTALLVPLGILLGALAVLVPALIWGGGASPSQEIGGEKGREQDGRAQRVVAPQQVPPSPDAGRSFSPREAPATTPDPRHSLTVRSSPGEAQRAPSLVADTMPLASRLGQGRDGQVIVRIEQSTSVEALVSAMYGTSTAELLELVRTVNPILVGREQVQPGLIVSFPQPGVRRATLEFR